MSIVFCRQCDNMLYMSFRDTGDQHSTNDKPELLYHCKHCKLELTADAMRADQRLLSAAVHTENYEDDQASYKQFINPYIREDPTLPHVTDIECANPACTRPPEAMRDVIIIKYDSTNLKFLYHCAHCASFWKSGASGIAEHVGNANAKN